MSTTGSTHEGENTMAGNLPRGRGARSVATMFYNGCVTNFPSHHVRLAYLRLLGAKVGRESAVFRGCTVLGAEHLVIGEAAVISFRCELDARGGLTIGDCVVVASDTQFISSGGAAYDGRGENDAAPIVVGDHVWIASRALVMPGVTIGRGVVVAAMAVVDKDIPDLEMVGGVPAQRIGTRRSTLTYRPTYRPLFF